MGTWHMEVGRMFLYLAFPVGLFHWFNQPENFREYVENTRRTLMPVSDPNNKIQYDNFVEERNRRHSELSFQQSSPVKF